ncbi:unnamed protein product [Caenorhabditis brenneri]
MADKMKLAVVPYVPHQGIAYFQHICPAIEDLLMDAEIGEVAPVGSNYEAAQEDDAMDTSEWNDRDVAESGHTIMDVGGQEPASPIMETPNPAFPNQMDTAREEAEDFSVDQAC